ncbi:MAG: hypothetical protein NDJ89_10650 [Oligoflexia bacterium]|nr:hypothetical protein [Oligoflexia bacterium]
MSSQRNSAIFLGRAGKKFGPYTHAEIQALRESGELASYSWIWEDAAGWKPLDCPPPEPASVSDEEVPSPPSDAPTTASAAPTRTPAPARAPAPATRVSEARSLAFDVICHDFHQVLSGKLQRVTDTGCELVSEEENGPQFNRRGTLVLNILDPATGRATNAHARLSSVSRVDGKWVCRLQWERCPELIA